ncbi:chemotaxis protein CheA, partial [Rhizobium sp. VS19-DRK62.2]
MNTLDPVAVFRIEAAEVFEQIESGLLDLTRRLDDKAQIDAVFRGLHTLKGSGSMFGFDALAAFTHHCETAFDRVRKGEVPATAELVAAVLAAQDHMRALVETPNGDHQAAGDRLLELLRAAVDGKSAEPVVAAAKDALNRWRIRFSLPHNAMINGTNPLGLLDELRDLGECRIVADTAGVPPLDLLVPTELHLSWEVFLTSDQPRSAIDDVFIFVIDDMKFEVETLTDAVAPAPVAEQPAIVVPLPVATPLGTVAVPAAVVIVPAAETLPVKIETPSSPPPADARQAKASESVRVPAERLDELMDRVGELVIAQSRLRQLANSSAELALRSVSEEIERLSGELRDTMMVLRMVPVATLFSRFRRLTHDLARETGKVIELVTEGETTEVDKTVIERLADPLVHLVRNSIDHGLEPPAERLSAGKSEGGTVTLSARQSGGEVIISIKDDGRGINRQRVRAKAESSGLIQLGQVLTDSDLLQLIFAPGFSTAAQITNLSGRGVGMDVVKKTVEALRGAIDVTSHDGQGSEVSLRIPLTLAIIDGLLVRVGTGRY